MENFVVGGGNRLAYAICEAVSEQPGTAYNPVFLYGGVGLGKTHLMQAVGHVVSQRDPLARVHYISSEAFLNDYVRALSRKDLPGFRQVMRRMDVLLIDDVQFFEQTDKLQEEFFHTFNELYQAGKQIILTSDRSPKQLSGLQERLVSRFESGVVCDIKPPNVETRIAILLRLAERAGLSATPGALEVLAERIRSNIRLLEGAFAQVQALCSLQKTQIESSIVEEVVREYGAGQEEEVRAISVPLIQELVGEYYNVTVEDLRGRKRTKPIVVPRQIAMFLSQELTEETLAAIAKAFQKKDHTTVMHACEKIRKLLVEDRELEQALRVLRGRIRSVVED
jgi:chromosomal replication initiator protein